MLAGDNLVIVAWLIRSASLGSLIDTGLIIRGGRCGRVLVISHLLGASYLDRRLVRRFDLDYRTV